MVTLLAESDSTLFLGEDFFPWMILAFGAAMVAGNVLALLRPPSPDPDDGDSERATDRDAGRGGAAGSRSGSDDVARPPLVRSAVMIVVGLAAAVWSIATLLA